MVLGFYEVEEKHRPPESIWLDPEALEAHFNAVDEAMRSGDREAVPDPGNFEQNELTRDLRR